mmetsp:Transcript_25891/g.39723  ORF Transcript_25891/g.39723 Transcript_25891/m.39723 type:complete len:117 (+) Transcript_25891:749-1099(+)
MDSVSRVIEEHPHAKSRTRDRTKKTTMKTIEHSTLPQFKTSGGVGARLIENLDQTSRIQADAFTQAKDMNQKKVYTQVFNAYLTPLSLKYLKTKGLNKQIVSHLTIAQAQRRERHL